GVAVAADDLGGDWVHGQAEPGADIFFQFGRDVGVSADRAGDFAGGDVGAGGFQAGAAPAQFGDPAGQLEPEGDRLGVDAVRAPDLHRVFVAQGLLDQRQVEVGQA